MSTATPENYMQCSNISIGPVVIPGQQYARGRTISRDSGTISEQLLNGTRFSKNVRDSQRIFRLSWADPVDITTISTIIFQIIFHAFHISTIKYFSINVGVTTIPII